MKVIYLDQNQWIRLAQAWTNPAEHKAISQLGAKLSNGVRAETICLPLTATNIYETYKINNVVRREDLGTVQANLSQGIVFVGRHVRLKQEVGDMVRDICGLPSICKEERWFLSNVFFEAFAEHGDERLPPPISDELVLAIKSDPSSYLFDFWMCPSETERKKAVRNWSNGSEQLRQRIERRRTANKDATASMKRKAYSDALFIDECEIILRMTQEAGAKWNNVSDIGASNSRKLIRETPIYYVEREIVLKLESQNRPVDENDFRDMASFCAVIPYADVVIAENQFINLARQAGVAQRYNTVLETDLIALADLI